MDTFTKSSEYYHSMATFPTYANYLGNFDLINYKNKRILFFQKLLNLHRDYFNNKKILEFGPDTGENALVFASLGAELTLAEPNINCHSVIKDYFKQHNLTPLLKQISSSGILDYKSDCTFDVVIAEGFLHTIQPSEAFLKVASGALNNNGLFLFSFTEQVGCFMEMFHKLLIVLCAKYQNISLLESAKAILTAKWGSITHTRSFKSWVMDCIENPFWKFEYFFCLNDFLEKIESFDFQIYSSWPVYFNNHEIFWHKNIERINSRINSVNDNIIRSSLSYMLGSNSYIYADRELCHKIHALIIELNQKQSLMCDSAILNQDIEFDPLFNVLSQLIEIINKCNYIFNKEKVLQFLSSMRTILDLLATKNFDKLYNECEKNEDFIATWGHANHYLVLNKGFM